MHSRVEEHIERVDQLPHLAFAVKVGGQVLGDAGRLRL
nr:MAG TPA: hypothetical protein [Caudoviricetes sp.]